MSTRQDLPTVEHANSDGARPPDPDAASGGHHRGATGIAERFREQPVLNSLLVLAAIAAIVIAYSAVGPSSSSSGASTRTTTVKDGVVQSTVSGSGTIQSSDQLNLGFKTSGT